MKVTYSGYYGAKNSGDDAFMEVASWGAKNYWRADDHLFFSSRLPRISTPSKCFGAHENYFSFSRAIYNIFLSDVFVSAGGSTFHSSLKNSDLRTYAKLKKRLGFKGRIGAIGISLGPFKSVESEKDTVKYLRMLDFLALRDTHSYNLACSYNLPFSPIPAFDLAALLPRIYDSGISLPVVHKTAKRKILGISICNYESYTGGDIQKESNRNIYMMEALSKLCNNDDIQFRYFIFNGHESSGDIGITNWLIQGLQARGMTNFEVVPYLGDVKMTYNKIKECDLMISTRLHASIFACFSGIPFFLLEYHRKCSDFLDDVGQSNRYRIYDADKDVASLVDEIKSILFDNAHEKPTKIEVAIEKSLFNFTKTML